MTDPIEVEPGTEDFTAQVVVALNALLDLGRPSSSVDRRNLWRRHNLPASISSFLSRSGAIEPPPGQPDDFRVKLRTVSDKGRQWLHKPTSILGALGGLYIRTVDEALGEFAREEHLPVDPHRTHILRSRDLWPENLWPGLRPHLTRFPAKRDLHRWIHHLRSSQAFAFNVFGPLAVGWSWAREMWRPFLGDVTRLQFEYPQDGDPDGDDPLQERSPDRLQRTRVDARVDHGKKEAALVEVKLTESRFGDCGASRDAGNPLRNTCTTPDLSLEEIAGGCYLVQHARRHYFRLPTEPGSLLSPSRLQQLSDDGCPLRGGLYQIARNLMMAQHVRASGVPVGFIVLAPGPDLNPSLHSPRSLNGHPDIVSFLRSVVHDEDRDAARFIDFGSLVADAPLAHPDAKSWISYMRRKYIEPLRRGAAAR